MVLSRIVSQSVLIRSFRRSTVTRARSNRSHLAHSRRGAPLLDVNRRISPIHGRLDARYEPIPQRYRVCNAMVRRRGALPLGWIVDGARVFAIR
jgi:hypothetical protein